MSVPSNVPSVFDNPPHISLEQTEASERTDTGPISHNFQDARPDDTPTSAMSFPNSIVDGINQSPLFVSAPQVVTPLFIRILANQREYHFAAFASGDILVPIVFPQGGVRLVPKCRRWLELNLLQDSEVRARRSSQDSVLRASVIMNCHNHYGEGRLCSHQRDRECKRMPCTFIHVDYSKTVSEGDAMTAFNLLNCTLPPMMMRPRMMAMQLPVVMPPVAFAQPVRVVLPAVVPPVQYVEDMPTVPVPTVLAVPTAPTMAAVAARPAVPAPAPVAVVSEPVAQYTIRVRSINYAFDVSDGKLMMRFKLRNEQAQARLVCREWLVNELKELDDPTRVARTDCASTHEHPGNWMKPCLFYLAHNCNKPAGTCGRAHIIADKVNVLPAPRPAVQTLPTSDDFAPLTTSSTSATAPTLWVSTAGARSLDFTVAPVNANATAVVVAPVQRIPEGNKSRTHRYTAWCNGSDKCPGYEKCMFIHPETVQLSRMDPNLPERIAFRADLSNGMIDFDGLYVMVYEALYKGIDMLKLIHSTKGAHRSNFNVFLNDDVVDQIGRLEMVDFGQLVSLWRSMVQVVRSEKTVEKLELDVQTSEGLIDFALSVGRDSRAEQHALSIAALTRSCFSNKYGDRMCFVARFAAEKKTELATFDEKVIKKFSGFCIPKKRDVCLATAWCCHHGGHVSTNGKEGKEQNGTIITLEGLSGKAICDANVPVLTKAKALRAELYEQFSARLIEALSLHQNVKDEESSTEFKAVAREATSSRDKLATARAKALEQARECEMEIAKVQDRLSRHVDATNKMPLLELKCELTELQHDKFLANIRLDNYVSRLVGEKSVLVKTETSARRSLADIKQTEGRLAKSAGDEGEDAMKRRSQLQTQLEEHVRTHQQFLDQLEADKEVIATTEEDIKAMQRKVDDIVARIAHLKSREMELDPVIAEARQKMEDLGAFIKRLQLPHEIKRAKEEMEQLVAIVGEELCSSEKMFVSLLGKHKSAVRSTKQFILTQTAIASLRVNIDEITAKRVAAIKSAATLKVEFEQACSHANAEVRAAEVMYAQMMEGRDIVKEARAKAKAASDEADAFRQSMEDRIENYRTQLIELEAVLDPLRDQKALARKEGWDAARIAEIDAQGKNTFKEFKAVKASLEELVEQKDDEDSDYNVQLAKLVREATRLNAETSQVLSGEALRERIATNARVSRLRELQLPVSIVNADLSDAPAVSSVRQTGGNGRSRVFVWKHGQQELSLEDRLDALEDTIVKARATRVASVLWLAHMLKQVQDLIIEARGTNALCPVAHFGYKPLDVAGCMMQLKRKFGQECEVISATQMVPTEADFVAFELERLPVLEDKDLAEAHAKAPKIVIPRAAPAILTTGRLSRQQARRAKKQDDAEQAAYELADQNVSMKFGKDATSSKDAPTASEPGAPAAPKSARKWKPTLMTTTPEEDAEEWALYWMRTYFWADEQSMVFGENKEARRAAEKLARAAAKAALVNEAKQARKEAQKAFNAELREAKAAVAAAAVAAQEVETVSMNSVKVDTHAANVLVTTQASASAPAKVKPELPKVEQQSMTIREQKEARLAAMVAANEARIKEEQAKAAKAKAKAKAAKDKKAAEAAAVAAPVQAVAALAEEVVAAPAVLNLSERTDRIKLMSSFLEEDARSVTFNNRPCVSIASSTATIFMVEAFTGKSLEVKGKTADGKRKTVELKNVQIGPMPVLACESISGRFMKGGIRCSTTEKEGKWFLEFECQATQSKNEQLERIYVVLDELIQHGIFANASDMRSKFQAKLFIADNDVKSDKSERPSAKKGRARKLATK